MAITYEPIASQTLGSATSGITFSSIPQTYTDIVAILNFTLDTNSGACYSYVNGIFTGTPYSNTNLTGDGSFALSSRASNSNTINITQTPINQNITNVIVHYMNYSNTTTNKTILGRQNTTASIVNASVSLWRSTAAINSISFSTFNTQNFIAGSTFTLYGIKAA